MRYPKWLPSAIAAMLVAFTFAMIVLMWTLLAAVHSLQTASDEGAKRTDYQVCAVRLQNRFNDLIGGLVAALVDNEPTDSWTKALRELPSATEVCEPLLENTSGGIP